MADSPHVEYPVSVCPIEQVLDELRAGRMIVLIDDEQRENEGDLVCAAQFATPEKVNFMLSEARGMLFVALAGQVCERLKLAPQSAVNTAALGTAYTISVDAHQRFGITTGVSAADRSKTIQVLIDPATTADDLARPGHIPPIRARDGGVLVRTGHTEGMVDLCALAGLQPGAFGIEIMNADGTMARRPQLQAFAEKHQLKTCTIADLVAYRLRHEKMVERLDSAALNTRFGTFDLITYASRVDPFPHAALCLGRVGKQEIDEPVLVRVHAQNLLGDVFADQSNPTDLTLHESMRRVQKAGEGAVLYLRQDPLSDKTLEHLHVQNGSEDKVNALLQAMRRDARFNVGIGSQILLDLGIRRMNLLTDHPQQYHSLDGFGLTIEQFVPLEEDRNRTG